jgi:hypothetical protein
MRRTWARFQVCFETPGDGGGGGSATPAGGGSAAAAPAGGGAPAGDGQPGAGSGDGQPGAGGQPGAEAALPAGLEWTKGLDRDRVAQAMRIHDWFENDPQGAYDYVTGLMRRNGLIRQPAAAAPAQPAEPRNYPHNPQTGEPLADIKIQETGQLLFSAEQQIRRDQWRDEQLDKRFKPVEQYHQTAEQREKANTAAASMVNEAWAWPHFQTFAEDILKEFNTGKTLEAAYRAVVIPKVEEVTKRNFAAELRKKGNASTANPAGAVPGSTKDTRKMPIRDLLAAEFRRRGIQ